MGRLSAPRLLPALVAAVLLAGCGGEDPPPTARGVAADLDSAIPSITRTVAITEDNDPNDALGRPGSYVEAVAIYDSRAECDDDLDITCGAKVEVFETEAAATKRRDYIQGVVMDTSGLLTEYDYLDDTVLLRVSGDLEPSVAAEYEKAFS